MLNVVSAVQAEQIIAAHLPQCNNKQTVPLMEGIGLVCAETIYSAENIPPFDRSTVDGFAVRARDTYGCSQTIPAMLRLRAEILMGTAAIAPLQAGECQKIPTGGMLPVGADAVVMHEYCENYEDGFIYVGKPCGVFENITRKGDDVKTGQLVLQKGAVITSRTIGQLAALGIAKVCVYKPIRVGILSTGDEIVPYDIVPPVGCVRDINSALLTATVKECAADVKCYPIVKDEKPLLLQAVEKAVAENDVVLLSGGSSAGDRDAANAVLGQLGQVFFHGIAIKPGKPTLFAEIQNKPVFALPGHPLAAALVCRLFVLPALCAIQGTKYSPIVLYAKIKTNIPSDNGREEVIPVQIAYEKNDIFARPVFVKSGVISVLNKADGYIQIERDSEGVNQNETVKVYMFARNV